MVFIASSNCSGSEDRNFSGLSIWR